MALYTQKAILRTFQQMLEEMPFDKITVSALVRRCEISSNTFYYHYQDIYALLNTWFHVQFDEFTFHGQPDFDWKQTIKDFLLKCKRHPRILYHIFDSLSRDQLEQYVFSLTDDVFYQAVVQRLGAAAVPERELTQITSFCRYAFIGFFLQFLWNRMEEDIDESVESLWLLFERFVQSSAAFYASDAP